MGFFIGIKETLGAFWVFFFRNLEFFAVLYFFGFFKFQGRKIETNLPELVSGDEDPPPIVVIVGLVGVGLDFVCFLRWVGSWIILESPNLHQVNLNHNFMFQYFNSTLYGGKHKFNLIHALKNFANCNNGLQNKVYGFQTSWIRLAYDKEETKEIMLGVCPTLRKPKLATLFFLFFLCHMQFQFSTFGINRTCFEFHCFPCKINLCCGCEVLQCMNKIELVPIVIQIRLEKLEHKAVFQNLLVEMQFENFCLKKGNKIFCNYLGNTFCPPRPVASESVIYVFFPLLKSKLLLSPSYEWKTLMDIF